MRSEMWVKAQARGVPPPARRRSAACGDASAWGLRWGVASQGMRLPAVPRAQEASQSITGAL